MKDYFKQLDALRAYAVLTVVFGHLPIISLEGTFVKEVYRYIQGVPVFFSISGFLITLIILKNMGEVKAGNFFKTFYIRRFLRIFPLYYFVVFLLIAFDFSDYRSVAVYDVLYISNIHYGLQGDFSGSVAPHFWSLSVEEQFYLFWPALLFVSSRMFSSFLAMTMVFLFTFLLTVLNIESFFISKVVSPVSYLSAGGILAFYFSKIKESRKATIWADLVFAFGLLLICFHHIGVFTIAPQLQFTLSIILTIVLVFRFSVGYSQRLLKGLFENRLVLYTGKISYGIYVYHLLMIFPVIAILKIVGWSDSLDPAIVQVVKIVFAFIVAALSWEFFEKRINAFKEKFPYKKSLPSE